MDELSTLRIALIDDDRGRRVRVRSWIESLGSTVVELDSAGDLSDFDIVCLDAGHPRARVTDVVNSLRERDVPVIAFAKDTAQATDALRAGAWEVQPEPIERERVEAAVRRARERQALARRVRTLQEQLAARSATETGDDQVVPLRELERRAIEKALAATRGSVEKAARMLGMGRATLYRRLATMGTSRVA